METALRTARRDKGLTQDQLADKAKVGQATVSELERGEYSPSLDIARRLALALGTSIDALFPNELVEAGE